MSTVVQVMFSAGGQFYAIPDLRRECGIWLGVEKNPLPVPVEWRRPGAVCACVMRGRDYYRIGIFGPQRNEVSREIDSDSELVRDYRDAAWWTPGLEATWVDADVGWARVSALEVEALAAREEIKQLRADLDERGTGFPAGPGQPGKAVPHESGKRR